MTIETGWTADRKLWDAVDAEVGQLSWRSVPFAATSAFAVPVKSGVYMICTSPPAEGFTAVEKGGPGLYTALYVGKGDLRARFTRHTGTQPKRAIKRYTRTYSGSLDFWYVSIESPSQVGAAEAALIHALRPPCNDQYPRLRMRLGGAVAVGQSTLVDAARPDSLQPSGA